MPEADPGSTLFETPLELPPHSRAMWAAGAAYAIEAAICASLLWTGYAWLALDGGRWAVVSAIVVLQPGVTQSFHSSVFRILANLIGVAVGLAAVWLLGTDPWQVILAMLTVILCCLALRLERKPAQRLRVGRYRHDDRRGARRSQRHSAGRRGGHRRDAGGQRAALVRIRHAPPARARAAGCATIETGRVRQRQFASRVTS